MLEYMPFALSQLEFEYDIAKQRCINEYDKKVLLLFPMRNFTSSGEETGGSELPHSEEAVEADDTNFPNVQGGWGGLESFNRFHSSDHTNSCNNSRHVLSDSVVRAFG